jgi:hypothetical protein
MNAIVSASTMAPPAKHDFNLAEEVQRSGAVQKMMREPTEALRS